MSFAAESDATNFTDESLDKWKHAVESLYVHRGYTVHGPDEMSGGESTCIVALASETEPNAIAFCYLQKGRFSASFQGKNDDLDQFLRSIRNLKVIQTSPGT